MSTLPQSELPAGAGNALLRILITGLDESILEKYASPDATSAQEKKEKGLPYPVSSHTAAPCDDARPTRVSRSRQRLHFGVVGAPNSLGCWGRGMPLTLHRDASRSTSDTSAFIGRVTISAKERELYLTALEDGTAEMECRLVIVVVEDDIDTEVVFNSGIRIVAVENAETFPARLSAARFEESTTYEMSLQEAALPAVNLQELSQVTEVWRAEWKVNRPTRFTAVKEQFPFLHTISPFSPSALKQRYMDYNDMRSGEEMAKAEGHTGPMVSLSLYTNDPRHSYHQEEWFLGLPPSTQQAMLKQAEQQGFPTTNLFEVAKVAPTPMEGYCWCGAHLPVAAPLKKRQEEIKSKNRNKEGPGSVGRISCSMGKTTTSVSTHTTMGGGGDSSTTGVVRATATGRLAGQEVPPPMIPSPPKSAGILF
ncbi:hypothetical protein AGDE_15489 [Angomonas deanei]|uniref:Uncharacterized protein n=1 Tax=Angomonas deanei TaxID=59799 RepID=A0A7G2C8Q8_9TRYP|nr:hypothetical protein AGDE_15489 [Angomonas deanei]CAD2214402.1 hypothetical protein, conserved [Angomonas deanei]|eukprot:EPY18973.1 hypothetical protein AGDE_15489 [Angomonas deanei]